LDGKITCLKDALNWLNPDIFYLNAALKEAQKAASKNEVPIGAVIVHNHKIIARAHNLKETCQDVTAHAEILAIKKAQKKLADWRLTDCVLYCTLEPCSMCAGAIEQARISRVVFGAQDLKNPANPVLQSSFVPRAACEQILKTFFKKKRVKNA
jgi:tRNA(adenine34) deaminase